MTAMKQRRLFRFPTAFTVLAGVLLLVWLASFLVTPGRYQLDKNGAPVPGTYAKLPACSAAPAPTDLPCVNDSLSSRFKQLWDSRANGLYGVESGKGVVGPWEEGLLYGSAAIFLVVLAVGALITVTMKTEAIQTGIGRLAMRFRHSGSVLVGLLMAVFALGGTSYVMWEETMGFFVLLVPLALALGYDRMVELSSAEFAEGSMGPTVKVACTFVEQTGRFAVIGSTKDTGAMLRSEAGTVITADRISTVAGEVR